MKVRELKQLDTYELVNNFLAANNWYFVSPNFLQGFELGLLLRLSKAPGDHRQEVNEIMFRKFYQLEWTASFIDGYCRRCSHIEPFLLSIEHSLVLIFQRDYEGGIKTIIPIVEGIIRKYLTTERSKDSREIDFALLKKSFGFLKEDLLKGYEEDLRHYTTENKVQVHFSANQIKQLTAYERQYYDKWFSFAFGFIDNAFYLNTKLKTVTTEPNRHAILHEYGLNIQYDLENYLKIYFVIQFLTWVFLRKENKSILNEGESLRYFEKIEAYKAIIRDSDRLLYSKHLLYSHYNSYNQELLRRVFAYKSPTLLPRKMMIKYHLFQKVFRFLWKRRMSRADLEARQNIHIF